MTLKTASLPELRQQSSDRIVDLSAQLEGASLPYRGKFRIAAERLEQYLEKRVLLENASAKTAQIESYGSTLWQERFTRLAQVEVPKGCPLTPAQLRDAVWRAIPPGKFKRFQEIFSDPHNYVVPQFTINRRGDILFIGNPDFSKMSVAGCLVSIDRIPDELCEKVRLVEFTKEERRDPVKRFYRKNDIVVINRLKRLWDCCEAVSKRDFRVFIIQKPESEATNRYKDTGPFPVGFHGTILFTREDLSDRVTKKNPLLGPKYSNPRRIAHFVTAYDAYRRTLHVDLGYDGEQAELSALRVGIEGSRKRIDSEWKSGAPKYQVESVRSQVKESLSTATEALSNGVNRHKARAVELLAKMVDSRDSTGRLNPRATSVVMERAERHLGSRLGEVRAKKSHNDTDESLLNEIINAEEAVLERFRLNLLQKADAVMLPKRESRLRQIVAAVRTKPAAEIMTELVPERAGLEDITARPFSTFAGLLRVGCLELEGALQRRQFKDAERAAVKLHIVTKLFSANVNIERMKDCLVDPEFVPVDYMKREILGLRQVLRQQILAGVHVEEYEARFKALARQVDTLDSMLDKRPGLRASTSDRTEYFRQVKKSLDLIVPERLAWDLVPERWRKASGQEPTQKTPA